MITLTCDNCDKNFEVDSKEAGGKVPCPSCGDINRVPETAGKSTSSQTPSTPGRDDAEKEICQIRPAMFKAHPFRYLLILLLIVGGLALAFWSMTTEGWKWIMWPAFVISFIGAIWWIKWWVATTLWIKISISNKRTVRYEGIVRRHSTEVLHDHVRSVDINQTFVQRIFNVGYIGIDSAGQDGIEIEIRDIPGPHRVKEIIDRYRKM